MGSNNSRFVRNENATNIVYPVEKIVKPVFVTITVPGKIVRSDLFVWPKHELVECVGKNGMVVREIIGDKISFEWLDINTNKVMHVATDCAWTTYNKNIQIISKKINQSIYIAHLHFSGTDMVSIDVILYDAKSVDKVHCSINCSSSHTDEVVFDGKFAYSAKGMQITSVGDAKKNDMRLAYADKKDTQHYCAYNLPDNTPYPVWCTSHKIRKQMETRQSTVDDTTMIWMEPGDIYTKVVVAHMDKN
jgi:hypothetical protein